MTPMRRGGPVSGSAGANTVVFLTEKANVTISRTYEHGVRVNE